MWLIPPTHLTATCQQGAVRLTGSNVSSEGRVEICFNNQWGTVCDDDWDTMDATVVCKQLNYTNNGKHYTRTLWMIAPPLNPIPVSALLVSLITLTAIASNGEPSNRGTGPIHLDQVQCSGTELTLQECAHDGIGVHDCSHSEDAGVICNGGCIAYSAPMSIV